MYTSRETYEAIATRMDDPIVERRTCRRTGKEFPIYAGDIALLKKLTPKVGAKEYPLPLPTLSPLARMQRRMMFRNERGLYKTTSAFSEKPIITTYHPSLGYTTVTMQEYSSDRYDAKKQGMSYDSSQSFLDQYAALLYAVPKIGTITINNENGDFNTFSSDCKDIYLCADAMWCNQMWYATTCKYVTQGVDLLNVRRSEQVAQCVSSHHLTKCAYVWYGENCYDCLFLYTCKNCTNCFLCTNLVDKQNYILNQPATPEQIAQIRERAKTATGLQELYDEFRELLRTSSVRPGDRMINCEHSIGSTISNSKDAFLCFDSHDIQGCRYCHVNEFNTDCMDCTIFNPQSSLNYEQICGGGETSKCVTGTINWGSHECYLSEFGFYSDHLLGCVNMQRASYCILNKQYNEEERERLATAIIGELQEQGQRGEFFPTSLCPFAYNDSVAMDYFPIHKVVDREGKETMVDMTGIGTVYLQEHAFIARAELDLGGERIPIKWRTAEYEINIPPQATVLQARDLPESIDDADNTVVESIILCETTGRPFRILAPELALYKKLGIALPRLHHDVRHTRRIQSRPAKKYYLRACDKTGEPMLSLYPQGMSFPVYSQQAYEKLVYG